MNEALVYARVSTEEQVTQGRSIDDQISVCSQWAERQGYSVVESFTDPGKSGSLAWQKRPGLKSLVERCQKGEIAAVIVLDTDRLARNTQEHLVIRTIFKKFNVRLFSTNQPSVSEDTPEGDLVDTIVAAVNAYLPQVTGRKVSLSMYEKFKEGWWPGWAPLGYSNKNIGTDERPKRVIVIDPTAGSLVKQAFELYASGQYTLESLAMRLNGLGLRSKTQKPIQRSGLQLILRNRFYIGQLTYKGETRQGKHQPLISQQLFYEVQESLDTGNRGADRKRKHQLALRGYIHCGICGSLYTASVNQKKHVAYYHCPDTQRKHSNKGQNVEVRELEREVGDLFESVQLSKSLMEKILGRAKQILEETHRETDREQREIENSLTRQKRRREVLEQKLLDGVIDDETYKRQHEQLEFEIQRCTRAVVKSESDRSQNIEIFAELLRLSRNIKMAYKVAPLELKRQYLQIFWERIEVKDRHITKAVPSLALQMLQPLTEVAVIKNQTGSRSWIRTSNPLVNSEVLCR